MAKKSLDWTMAFPDRSYLELYGEVCEFDKESLSLEYDFKFFLVDNYL